MPVLPGFLHQMVYLSTADHERIEGVLSPMPLHPVPPPDAGERSTGLERALDSLACKEVTRLQDIINAAPHSEGCYSNRVSPLTGFSLPCNCWKEKALEP